MGMAEKFKSKVTDSSIYKCKVAPPLEDKNLNCKSKLFQLYVPFKSTVKGMTSLQKKSINIIPDLISVNSCAKSE